MNAELEQFMRDPAVRREHEDWLKLPATQRAIRAVKQLNEPFIPVSSDPNVGAQCHHIQCGIHHALRQLQTIHTLGEEVEEVPASYGSDEILRLWGREQKPTKRGGKK